MVLQVRIQDASETEIQVPWSTGIQDLDERADAWLFRIPHPKEKGFFEYIITPINRLIWQDIWTITIVTSERPGTLARAATFLGQHRINIVSMNTCTIEHWEYHSHRLIVDCSRYQSEVDHSHSHRIADPNATLNHLKRLLTIEFIEEIAPPPYPSITIDRCLTFWSLYQESLRANYSPPGKRLRVSKGRIKLPEVELSRLANETENSTSSSLRILINIDQSAELIRVFPFRRNRGIIPLSLSVSNRPGALAAVADSLSLGGFNILASKAWSSEEAERTSLWLLIHALKIDTPVAREEEVRKGVISTLTASKTLAQFDLAIDSGEI